MANKSSRTIRVILKMPIKVADFIVRAQTIHDTMAANPKTFPSPSPALTVLAADIADLVTKEASARARTVGAVADRDAAKLAELRRKCGVHVLRSFRGQRALNGIVDRGDVIRVAGDDGLKF